MRIMIVTDAWFPQTNGVVNTLAQTAAWLVRFGHEVTIAAPRDFRTVACPSYPEIRMAVRPMAALARKLQSFGPQAVHIATAGPLGFAARHTDPRRVPMIELWHVQLDIQLMRCPRGGK